MSSRDTTPDAESLRTGILQRMSPAERCAIAVELSVATRETTLANIRRRHAEYDERSAELALFRVLLGDELFRRVYPHAPLLAP